jgi:hypothetical protein
LVLSWKTDSRATLKFLLSSALDLKGKDMRTWLQGKKTYIVGVGAIVAAVVAFTQGTIDGTQAVEAIVGAILAMTIRAGITTATTL